MLKLLKAVTTKLIQDNTKSVNTNIENFTYLDSKVFNDTYDADFTFQLIFYFVKNWFVFLNAFLNP